MTGGDVLRTLQAAHEERRAIGVELEGLRTVPGLAVRAAAGLTALLVPVAAGFLSIRGPVAVLGDVLVVAFVLLVAWRPRAGWCAWLVLLGGLRVLLGGPLGPGQLAALLLVVHLAVLASLLAARVEPGTRVEVAVPLGMLRRAWRAQVGAQAGGLVVWLVGPGGVLPGGDVWRLVALVAVVALVLVVLPARRPR
ncbi:MAG TPA: hypothetical protein VGC04_09170 [Cellulomonas sp.]